MGHMTALQIRDCLSRNWKYTCAQFIGYKARHIGKPRLPCVETVALKLEPDHDEAKSV
jgi:hypothetical protein